MLVLKENIGISFNTQLLYVEHMLWPGMKLNLCYRKAGCQGVCLSLHKMQ